AAVLQRKRRYLRVKGPVLDTCGTGGDELGTFNISSLSAIIASACGAVVAKHGNRAVSSLSGSADFFKELGIAIDLDPVQSEKLVEKTKFVFLFAPLYHSAMRHAAQARREMGIKTIMNLLGPLVNPAGAEYQIIGVYADHLCLDVARAARMLGIKRVMVVHGFDGQDEISVTGPTRIVMIDENDNLCEEVFHPEKLGIKLYQLKELKGGSAPENARAALEILLRSGSPAVREAVLLNAGAGLFVYGCAGSIEEGYKLAGQALSEGKAKMKLDEIIEESNRLKQVRN
ncbi:MAG: anthranilate phosphoribosyltransferase, partial [Spirochaetota bacterium]